MNQPDPYGFINRQSREWAALIGQPKKGFVYVSDFDIKDGIDCSAAIYKLMRSLDSSGFITIQWPAGTYVLNVTSGPLAFPRFNVVWQGCGGSAAGTGATKVIVVGNGSTAAITMNDCFGCEIRDMFFQNSVSTFTGPMVAIKNSGVTDPQKNALRHVSFYDPHYTCSFVDLDKSILSVLEGCNFVGGNFHVVGFQPGGYSNVVSMLNCQSADSSSVPIQGLGEAWTIQNHNFQQLHDGRAGAILTVSTARPDGVVISGCWTGDVSAANGTWYTLWGNGYSMHGNQFAGDGTNLTLAISLNAVVGADITGNHFENLQTGISCDTAGCDRINTEPNNWTNVTTKLANTQNLLGYDLSSQSAWEWAKNGKIREWGTTTVTTGTPVVVVLPKALSAVPETYSATLRNPATSTNTVYVSGIATTSITLNAGGGAGANTVGWEITGKE